MISPIKRILAVLVTACIATSVQAEQLLPDFAIEQIEFSPTPSVTGETFRASVTITNAGDVAGSPGMLRVWLSRGTWVFTNETGDAEIQLTDELLPGGMLVVDFPNLTAPETVGYHHFRAFVDADGETDEGQGESNNQTVEPYTLGDGSQGDGGYTPSADFAIHSIILDPVPTDPGLVFQATVTVTNWGQVAGAPGLVRVWATHAGVPAIGESGDAEVNLTNLLDAGASRSVVFTDLPGPETTGYHHFYAFVDADGDTEEPSEYNTLSAGYTIEDETSGDDSWKKPDFSFSDFTLTPTPTVREASFDASITVKNSGVIAGTAGVLRIWVSRATTAGAGESADAAGEVIVGILQPSEVSEVVFTNLVSPAVAGTHFFRAFVDADGETAELSEYNNHIASTYTLPGDPGDPGTGWEQADFALSGIVLSPTPTETNQTFDASVTVRNTGSASGDAGWLRVWAGRATAADPGTSGDLEVAVGMLDPDETWTFSFIGLESPGTYGTFHFRAFADADANTEEVSEYNNHMSSVYTLAGEDGTPEGEGARADYVVTELVLNPVPAASNDWFDVQVTVRNSGSAAGTGASICLFGSRATWATPEDVEDADETAWIEGPIPAGSVIVTNFTLQALAEGTHHVRAYVVSDDPEWSKGDNQLTQSYSIGTPSSPGEGEDLPDFAVAEMTFIGLPPTLSGDEYFVRVTVENRGGVSGDAGTLYLFSSKPTFADLDDVGACSAAVAIGTLDAEGAGQTKTFDVKLTAPVERGTHHVRAYILSPEDEFSTGDNQKTITYRISEIDVQVVVVGNEIHLTWNNYWGETYRIYRSLDIANPEGWVLLESSIPSARPTSTNTHTHVDDDPQPAGFYRVAVEGPESP